MGTHHMKWGTNSTTGESPRALPLQICRVLFEGDEEGYGRWDRVCQQGDRATGEDDQWVV